MPFKYITYFYLRCDVTTCQQETPQRIDDKTVSEEAENKGWVTPDGLKWYCPTHANTEEARA